MTVILIVRFLKNKTKESQSPSRLVALMTRSITPAKHGAHFQGWQERKRTGGGVGERGGQARPTLSTLTGAWASGSGAPGRWGRGAAASWAGVWRHLLRLGSRWLRAARLPLAARFRKGSGINEAGGGLGHRWGKGAQGRWFLAWAWGRRGPGLLRERSPSEESRYLRGNPFV